MSKLIGLHGKAGVGKDTVAKHMYGFATFWFAAPLKRAASSMLCFPIEFFNDPDLKNRIIPEWGFTPRRFLQVLGTEVARNFRDDFWIRRLEIDSFFIRAAKDDRVVIDVRFNNEADWIRNQGGEIWHVCRDDVPEVESHSSEAGIRMASTDKVFDNNGTIGDIPGRIRKLLGDDI